jgi:hypothetical protein
MLVNSDMKSRVVIDGDERRGVKQGDLTRR